MTDPRVVIANTPCDCLEGVETCFGKRWGGEVIQLTPEHLGALKQGQTLYLDVEGEYLINLQLEATQG